ncbi:MAG: hypothetical protein ACR2FV_15470 [Ornithinimicrobium sp.]|uniref:hypothetical protein n=1 Tax=Ornithinimicrobium sp. TaxID=1977084 RepID=UPI003D9BFC53
MIETPEDIHRIITGQPATHVEVIIPASFLTPDPAGDTDTTAQDRSTDSGDDPGRASNGDAESGRHADPDPRADSGDEADADPPSRHTDPPSRHTDPPSRHTDPQQDHPQQDHPQQGRPRRCRPGGVAEIVGYGFLTGEHARELVLTPGSTLHRLLTDPADGRLLERTIAAYRPDQAMITQLRAADVFCRAPGCLVPARRCDLDHEREYDEGGPTAEPNLVNKPDRTTRSRPRSSGPRS